MTRSRTRVLAGTLRRLLAITLAGIAGIARSETVEEPDLAQIYGDRSFVSIATGTRQPASRAPSTATVITAEQIKAAGFVDLDQVLETVPGFHVSRTPNYTPRYVLRGISRPFNGPQVLVLVNGVPVTSVYQGDRGIHRGWHSTPVENIARVEVVRGPGSALYGADAFAGVINVITKTADDAPGQRAGALAGSLDTYGAWWQYGGRQGELAVAAHLQAGKTGGPRGIVAEDFQTALDRAAGTRLSLAPARVNAGHQALDAQLDLAWRQWRLRADYSGRFAVGSGTGSFQALSPAEHAYHRRMLADLSYQDEKIAPDWAVSAQLSAVRLYERLNAHLLPPGAFGAFPDGPQSRPGIWERHGRFEAAATYTGWANHHVRLGAGAGNDAIYQAHDERNFRTLTGPAGFMLQDLGSMVDFSATESFLYPHSRGLKYLYVQDELTLGKDLYLTAGLRHDRYSDFGGTTNPRLALVWEAAYELTAKLMLGQAFRAPTFDDQYNTFFGPARRLSPERLAMTEAALIWRPDFRWQISLNLFRYRMRDVILLDVALDPATGTFVPTMANKGRQDGRGGELEASVDVTRTIRLAANVAYQHAVDRLTAANPGVAPGRHLFVKGEWRFAPGWLVGSQWNRVADTPRAAGDPRPPVAAYATFDLNLRIERPRIAGQAGPWSFGASVRNLFDADAREPSASGSSITHDLPLPGRTWLIEASAAF